MRRGVGVDISSRRGQWWLMREQVEACGLGQKAEIRVGDWTRGSSRGGFDLIVSNPPYVPSADLAELPREVRDFDPRLALDGGVDGLDAYRRVIPESRSLLSGGGWLLVEIGAGQAADVLSIVEQFGFGDVMIDKDLAGHDRVVAARRP